MKWLIYGPTGITGRLIVAEALARGHRPTLAGRPSEALSRMGHETGLRVETVPLDKTTELEKLLSQHALVLHVAGPFARTGPPMLAAAVASGTPYVDVNGESEFLQKLFHEDSAARQAGIPLVGGAGFGVTAGEGLALRLARKLPLANWIRVAVAADSAYSSAGAAASTAEVLSQGGRRVVDGRMTHKPLADTVWEEVTAQGKRVHFAAAPLAELDAVARATGIANITVGVPMHRAVARVLPILTPILPAVLKRLTRRSKAISAASYGTCVWATAGDPDGRTITTRLETGEAYSYAARAAVHAVEAMLASRAPAGAWTPTSAFGDDYLIGIADTIITDSDSKRDTQPPDYSLPLPVSNA